MAAGMYGNLGVIVAMIGVAIGLLIKVNNKIDRIEGLLETKRKDS